VQIEVGRGLNTPSGAEKGATCPTTDLAVALGLGASGASLEIGSRSEMLCGFTYIRLGVNFLGGGSGEIRQLRRG
jgi:hypothetical protein